MATLLGGKGGVVALQLEMKRLFWSTYRTAYFGAINYSQCLANTYCPALCVLVKSLLRTGSCLDCMIMVYCYTF